MRELIGAILFAVSFVVGVIAIILGIGWLIAQGIFGLLIIALGILLLGLASELFIHREWF